MSHIVDVAQGHKTHGIVACLPIVFGLGVSMWVPRLARSSIEYDSVGEEKEIGNEVLPGLDARSSDD